MGRTEVNNERTLKVGYVRFMNDWVVLSPNRWKLKKAVQIVNQTLNELKVEKYPDKIFIGRMSKSFICFFIGVFSDIL